MMPIVLREIPGVEIWEINVFVPTISAKLAVLAMPVVLPTLTVTTMVDVLLVPLIVVVFKTTVLLVMVVMMFAETEFALIPTPVLPMLKITRTVCPKPEKPTVKLMDLVYLAKITLTVVF